MGRKTSRKGSTVTLIALALVSVSIATPDGPNGSRQDRRQPEAKPTTAECISVDGSGLRKGVFDAATRDSLGLERVHDDAVVVHPDGSAEFCGSEPLGSAWVIWAVRAVGTETWLLFDADGGVSRAKPSARGPRTRSDPGSPSGPGPIGGSNTAASCDGTEPGNVSVSPDEVSLGSSFVMYVSGGAGRWIDITFEFNGVYEAINAYYLEPICSVCTTGEVTIGVDPDEIPGVRTLTGMRWSGCPTYKPYDETVVFANNPTHVSLVGATEPLVLTDGDTYTIEVGDGENMTIDYRWDWNNDPQPAEIGLVHLDSAGRYTFTVSEVTQLGETTFTHVRNTLRTDWVPLSGPKVTVLHQPGMDCDMDPPMRRCVARGSCTTFTFWADPPHNDPWYMPFTSTLWFESSSPSLAVTFSPASIPLTPPDGDPIYSTVEVCPWVSAATGSYDFQVYASGEGLTNYSTSIIEITDPPSFSLIVDPEESAQSINTSEERTVRLTSLNCFNSDVTLSTKNLPAGVAVSFDPLIVTVPLDGSMTSTMTVNVGREAVAGTYTFQVVATGRDRRTRERNVTLTIMPKNPEKLSASPSHIVLGECFTLSAELVTAFDELVELEMRVGPPGESKTSRLLFWRDRNQDGTPRSTMQTAMCPVGTGHLEFVAIRTPSTAQSFSPIDPPVSVFVDPPVAPSFAQIVPEEPRHPGSCFLLSVAPGHRIPSIDARIGFPDGRLHEFVPFTSLDSSTGSALICLLHRPEGQPALNLPGTYMLTAFRNSLGGPWVAMSDLYLEVTGPEGESPDDDSLGAGPCDSPQACDDGLFCNGQEQCDSETGTCRGGGEPCTDAPNALCDEDRDLCVECLSNGDCDDGLFCNGAEQCSAGACAPGEDPCPDFGCHEGTDQCGDPYSPGDCDDGQFCNGLETLIGDVCLPGVPPCPADGDLVCDEALDACVGCAADQECDDGRYCNGTERCVSGACAPGEDPCPAMACNESHDQCSGICSSDDDCDDGLFCNGPERCELSTGLCDAGSAPCPADSACNEGANTCDIDDSGAFGCSADTDCDDGLFCNGPEHCNRSTGGCYSGIPPCTSGRGGTCDEQTDTCGG